MATSMPDATALTKVDTAELEGKINSLLNAARSVTAIDSREQYEVACNTLLELRRARKMIQEWFAPLVEAAHRAHKALTMRRSQIDQPYEACERALNALRIDYEREQQRLRMEEEARIRREHEERERARIAAEAAAREQERRAREELALAEAQRLEAEGRATEAAAVIDAAIAAPPPPAPVYVPPPPPVVAAAIPRVPGVTTRRVWRARVIDFQRLPDEYKLPNQSAIDAVVRKLGSNHGIPGVEAYEDAVGAIRA